MSNTITITRNAARNDITVAGTTVQLTPPGANREARAWLQETLFADQPTPRGLRGPGPGKHKRRRRSKRPGQKR